MNYVDRLGQSFTNLYYSLVDYFASSPYALAMNNGINFDVRRNSTKSLLSNVFFAKHGGKLHRTSSTLMVTDRHGKKVPVNREDPSDSRPLIQRLMGVMGCNRKKAQLAMRQHQ